MAETGESPGERISDAEHAVMEALWEKSPQTAVEVCDSVCGERGWSMPTVKTLLSRLVAKGAVSATSEGRRFRYRPAVERETIAGGQADSLVDRLFGGRVSPLVAQLAEQREIDPEDLAELEALVRSLRK